MPKKGQTAVSIPVWVWEIAEDYFKAHQQELEKKGVMSVTALIKLWVIEGAKKLPSSRSDGINDT